MPELHKESSHTRSPRLFVARSSIHGLGLFAGEHIEWGRRLIEYQGQALSKNEVKRRQKFYDSIGFSCLIEFGDGTGVDGLIGGNESRFINHSPKPNVAALREDGWRIIFYSLDNIVKGDELTFNYGFDPINRPSEDMNSIEALDRRDSFGVQTKGHREGGRPGLGRTLIGIRCLTRFT